MSADPRKSACLALRLASWVGLVLLASSCGVPKDRHDHPLNRTEIGYAPRPEPVATPATVSVTTTTANGPDPMSAGRPPLTAPLYVAYPLDVYWIDGSTIRPTRRAEIEATLESAIGVLKAGPEPAETAAGLRSVIPSADMIVAATTQSGTATISLAPGFLTLPGAEQTLAIAQIVYTITIVPGIGQVDFRLGDQPLPVPTAEGQPSSGAVSRDDYASLLNAPPSPTTSTPTEPAAAIGTDASPTSARRAPDGGTGLYD